MKKLALFCLMVSFGMMIAGCATSYRDREDYNKGKSLTWGGSREWAQIERDQQALALKGLAEIPITAEDRIPKATASSPNIVKVKVPDGTDDEGKGKFKLINLYKVKKANLSSNRRYNFVLESGAEIKSSYIAPLGTEYQYLPSGNWKFHLEWGGTIFPPKTKYVGPQINTFLGEEICQYFGAEW